MLEQYTISLKTADQVEPSKTATVIATVKDAQEKGKSGVTVSIKVDVDTTSGGHDHGESVSKRSKGTLDAASRITGADGMVSFTFGAPDVSGVHTFTATCVSPACTNVETAKINVMVDGLVPIPSSPLYTFIGDNNKHTANHFLTPAAATVLRNMAASYYIEDKFWQLKQALRRKRGQYTYTASKLHVNDASLKWGGKFDIHGGWIGDHKAHKRGIVVDIRANQININNGAIPPQSFGNFQKMAKSYRADAQVHCGDKSRQPPMCVGIDGSQDDLRHFHVILIGGIDK